MYKWKVVYTVFIVTLIQANAEMFSCLFEDFKKAYYSFLTYFTHV